MNRIARSAARVAALLLAASLGSQAFANCRRITFSFDNNTGVKIRVIQVAYNDAALGAWNSVAVTKTCVNGFTCVTPAANLSPVASGDNIVAVDSQYYPWVGGAVGWGPAVWSGPKVTVMMPCVDDRNYGTWTII